MYYSTVVTMLTILFLNIYKKGTPIRDPSKCRRVTVHLKLHYVVFFTLKKKWSFRLIFKFIIF